MIKSTEWDIRFTILHLESKQGVNVLLSKYKMVKEAILDSIAEHGEIS